MSYTLLLPQLTKHIFSQSYFPFYIATLAIGSLCNIFSSFYMASLGQSIKHQKDPGKINEIFTWMIVLSIVSIIISPLKHSMKISVDTEMNGTFMTEGFSKYKLLSIRTKDKYPIDKFTYMLNDSKYALKTVGFWLIENMSHLVSDIISAMSIVHLLNNYYYLAVFFAVFTYLFYKVISYRGNFWKEHVKMSSKLRSKQKIARMRFEMNDISVKSIVDVEQKRHLHRIKNHQTWKYTHLFFEMSKKFLMIIVFSSVGYADLIISFGIVKSLIGTINSILSALDNLERDFQEFKKYDDFWKKNEKHMREDPEQLPLPDVLEIEKINTKLSDKFSIKCNTPFTITKGNKIIVRGPSGAGKTTLIRSLQGLEEGTELNNEYTPSNFYSSFVYFSQNIRRKMPFSDITIHDLFGNRDPELIKKACKMAMIWDWVIAQYQNKEKDEYDEDYEDPNPIIIDKIDLTKKIFNNISGGQETRLALAVRISELMANPIKSALVLDEPEQGMDPPLAYQVIQNIFDSLSETTIIVISHLEKLDKFKWHRQIYVENGIISPKLKLKDQ